MSELRISMIRGLLLAVVLLLAACEQKTVRTSKFVVATSPTTAQEVCGREVITKSGLTSEILPLDECVGANVDVMGIIDSYQRNCDALPGGKYRCLGEWPLNQQLWESQGKVNPLLDSQ